MHSGRRLQEIVDFDQWLGTLPHPYKVVIAGNHDLLFETYPTLARARLQNATYLENSGAQILGLRFWGSPVQPTFHNWAFNSDRGAPIRRYWKKIPADTDVLVTHGPPFGILDKTDILGPHLGCEELSKAVARIKPRLHVFGHIHGGYGTKSTDGNLISSNCAVLNERYLLSNAPTVVELNLLAPLVAK